MIPPLDNTDILCYNAKKYLSVLLLSAGLDGVFVDKSRKISLFLSILSIVLAVLCAIMFLRGNYTEKLFGFFGGQEQDTLSSSSVFPAFLSQMSEDIDVVFLGDSLTAGGAFTSAFPDCACATLGFSGAKISMLSDAVPLVKKASPEKLFLLVGINSLHNGTEKHCAELYQALLDDLRNAAPDADIYIQSVLPVSKEKEISLDIHNIMFCSNDTIRSFNRQLETLAEDNDRCFYVDLHTAFEKDGVMNADYTADGIHLTEAGYSVWYDLLRPYLDT